MKGIRLGTAAVTTQGMGPDEMARIAQLLVVALREKETSQRLRELRAEVRELATAFAPYDD